MQLSPTRSTGLLAVIGVIAVLLGACSTPSPPSTPARSDSDSTSEHGALLFADDFTGKHVDGQRWNRCHWWGPTGCTIAGNHELQWYLPKQVGQSNGSLRLTAVRRPTRSPDGTDYSYRSGMITTGRGSSDLRVKPKFVFRYGYLETRARVPRGAGLWPALWLLPASNRSLPEIDILEVRGSQTRKASMHLHTSGPSGQEVSLGEHRAGDDLAAGWHVFALDWRSGSLRWLVDGIESWRVTGRQVPSEPMYFVANLAVGGDWPGPPTARTPFPATFELDYVKVWKAR